MTVEACVNSAFSAAEAMAGGARRVELCENLADGGTTPGPGTISLARKVVGKGLFVMIRPRGGDFLYTDEEFEIMRHDILAARELGADGVVFGILEPGGRIDTERMRELVALARPMGITCHRAFDMTEDPLRALEDLIRLGIDRVLTSGQAPTALAGAITLRRLVEAASGRITVMPGGGIKEHNIAEVARLTGASEFHVRLEKKVSSRMDFRRQEVSMGTQGQSEYEHTVTDRERIRQVVSLLA